MSEYLQHRLHGGTLFTRTVGEHSPIIMTREDAVSTEAIASTNAEEPENRVFRRIWLKIYNEDVLADPRIVGLPDSTFRTLVELMVVANNDQNPGYIAIGTDSLARVLRTTSKKLERQITELIALDLVREVDGALEITNPRRHYYGPGLNWSDSAEGQAARKRKERAAACHSDSHGDCKENLKEDHNHKDPEVEALNPAYYYGGGDSASGFNPNTDVLDGVVDDEFEVLTLINPNDDISADEQVDEEMELFFSTV